MHEGYLFLVKFPLADLLTYMHFDPSPFPRLTSNLEEQHIMRDETMPMKFGSSR